MGVDTYKTSTTLPQDYIKYLPSTKEIEENLLKLVEASKRSKIKILGAKLQCVKY